MLEIEIIKVYKQQKCVNGNPSQDRLIAFQVSLITSRPMTPGYR
jgi:hypothetical protein